MSIKPLYCVWGGGLVGDFSYFVKLKQRFVLCLMCSLCVIIFYNMRFISGVSWIQSIRVGFPKNLSAYQVCPSVNYSKVNNIIAEAELSDSFDDNHTSIIFESFFIGYSLTHIPGGYIADKWGGRNILCGSVLTSAVITIITPLVINEGTWISVSIVRTLLGLAQGPVFPAIMSIMAYWVPAYERGRYVTIVSASGFLGLVLANIYTDWLHHLEDWKMPFYVWGFLSIIWVTVATVVVFSSPKLHPWITEEELCLLTENIPQFVVKKKIPWKAIFSDPTIYGLMIGKFGDDWLNYAVIYDLAMFMYVIQGYESLGKPVNCSILMAAYTLAIVVGFIGDYLIVNKGIRIVTIRKYNSAIGIGLCILFVLITVMAECIPTIPLICYVAAHFVRVPVYSGLKINALDVSVHFAGTVVGLISGCGEIAGLVVIHLISYISKDDLLLQWQVTYWLNSSTIIACLVVYLITAAGERRKWDYLYHPLDFELSPYY